jgi:hypothetical protein
MTNEINRKFYAVILIVVFGGFIILQTSGQPTSPTGAATTSDQDYQRLLNEQASILKRSASLLAQQEDFFKKQEAAFRRYERILDTWERQQQQYQRYLDSLPKK